MPRDNRPRKKKKDDTKSADPEKLYLMIGGGVAALLVVALVIFFAVRPSRKAADAADAGKSAADAPFAAKPPEAQDASTVKLSNLERKNVTGKGRDARAELSVDFLFAGFPAERGRYYLVVDSRKDQKELEVEITTREGQLGSTVTGPMAKDAIKVWLVYKPDGMGAGKVVSNTLTLDGPKDENEPGK
jgi:hypothetical protein